MLIVWHKEALNITTVQMVAFWRAAWNSNMGEIRRLNVEMNGPRVIWGRMTALTLSLFILFKEHNKDSEHETVQIIGSISYFVDKVNREVLFSRHRSDHVPSTYPPLLIF